MLVLKAEHRTEISVNDGEVMISQEYDGEYHRVYLSKKQLIALQQGIPDIIAELDNSDGE